MTAPLHVLVVAPTPTLAQSVTSRLLDMRLNVTLVSSFKAASQGLREAAPDLLISEVKLGEFNGLHLALRARSRGISTIVLGDGDQVIKRDAAALGAEYLPDSVGTSDLKAAVHAATSGRRRYRRRTIHAA
jgi:DNA-binding response OmpR family regulator